MKKLFSLLLATLVMLAGCGEINDRIDSLENRLDDFENNQITTIEQQITAIRACIPNLEKADSDLKNYILALQTQAANLTTSITATNQKIDEMKKSLEADFDAEIAALITQLEGVKSEIEAELATLSTLIEQLQARDTELEGKIAELKKYVDSEISATKDWVEATFATLDQYNSLASEVATIKVDIEAVNVSIAKLESGIEQIVKDELGKAIEPIKNDLIKSIATEITQDYTSAISTACQEITAAYTKAIKESIAIAETSMKEWVNKQLAGYYTIAETDAKLKVLQTALEDKITASQEYMEGVIADLDSAINKKVNANSKLIADLEDNLSLLAEEVAQNASDIISNTNTIEANAENIRKNALAILNNDSVIESNAELIAENKSLIAANNALIKDNQAAIALLQSQVSTNAQTIVTNATAISKNASDISANAAQIANNAAAIANNLAAITTNAADIVALQEELVKTTKEITTAYKNAIETAITTLNGELRDALAEEVATINTTIEALTARVAALEKEVKNIKVSIYNIQGDIATLQEQVAAILARIQSISFVPKYADGKATMYYTNSGGKITAGTATLDFELQPASTASELVAVWESALSAKAVYTLTRAAAGEFINLAIEGATAKDGILTVVISGAALDEAFFRSEISANVRVQVSDGNNQVASEYVNMVPWTTDNIAFTDANFKAVLLEKYDANSDGEISSDEAVTVTSLDVSATIPQITSLEGIEYFTNLESLDCSYNKITSLDLANNTKLTTVLAATNSLESVALPATVTTLDLSNNKLATVDVSKMKGLTSLNLSINKLASLNVSQNKQLTSLLCLKNELVSLDVANLTLLTELNCSNNHIESLNLSKNTALTTLDVSKNALTTLDVTKCNLLVEFACNDNSLTKLYLGNQPSLSVLNCSANNLAELSLAGCSALTDLDCSKNGLTALNIVPASKLQILNCSTNALTMLDISNNALLTTLDCSGNPALVKLWVKDDAQQDAVAINKDNTTSTYYNNGGLNIPDAALKTYLVNSYDDDGDGEISIVEADNITMVNCSGKGVTDLTGLESCTNLVTLNCSNNNITTINLPNLKQLRTLTCNANPIEHINLDNCTALEYLNLQGVTTNAISGTAITLDNYTQADNFYFTAKFTPFTSFTVKNTPTLTDLEFYGDFTDVAVTNNTALTSLVFYSPAVNATLSGNSALEGVDVSKLTSLELLDVQKCKLQSLDVTKNLALTSLICNNNSLTTLDVSNNTSLVKFYCNDNKLPRINVVANTALQEFDIANNLLSALNIRSNTALTYLNVSNNAEISMVDIQYNTALVKLYAEGLSIGEITFVVNTALTDVKLCNNTNLKTIIVGDKFTTRNDYLHFDMGGVEVYDNAGNSYGYPYKVGQYIPWFNGGVVCEIANGGQNGKMVSVTETRLAWSTEKITTNARNNDDGMANMNTIKALNPNLSKYPAFKWCADYGTGGWYLPAYNELKTIYNNKSAINSTLSANGYTSLGTGDYWSSTEYSNDGAYELYFSNGNSHGSLYGKNNTYNVRAVLAF
ncbi:MAG: DUF1566 domain-containing protein [Bacteroidales bacterium]|nr:DUF1566 domain-containing protein [Bacteroidales bacterium]